MTAAESYRGAQVQPAPKDDCDENCTVPFCLGTRIALRSAGPDAATTREVRVYAYKFRRPQRFPLTRALLLTWFDGFEVGYRALKDKNHRFLGVLMAIFLSILTPFFLVVGLPVSTIYELTGCASSVFLEDSEFYERESYKIDKDSWCLSLLQRQLETDGTAAGPSPDWLKLIID